MMTKKVAVLILVALHLLGCDRPVSKPETKIAIKVKDQEHTYVHLHETNEILKDLYDFKGFDSLGNIVWSGRKIDFPKIPVSYDNYYHTSVDTTIYFKDSEDDSCALLILANYNIQLDKRKEYCAGSHFEPVSLGIAMFVKRKEGWELYQIKKHVTELGYFGIYRTGRQDAGKISLKKIGDNWTCLSFKQGIGGSTGVFWGYERLYSIEKRLPKYYQAEDFRRNELRVDDYEIFTQIFSYNYHHNYYFPDLDYQNSIDIELKMIPNSKELYTFRLIVDEMNYHVETNRVTSRKKSIREYVFSPRLNVYLEK